MIDKIVFMKCRVSRRLGLLSLIMAMFTIVVLDINSQPVKKRKEVFRRSISSTMPYGYTQVGNTDLCYSKDVTSYNASVYSIDIQGMFDGYYYGSTYGNHGYDVAIKVGDNAATFLDCKYGSTVNGISFESEVVAQSELARVCYHITNTNDWDETISLGIHADVMIGNNDAAPIIRKIDVLGNTYGLALLDGNGAQLCVLFGDGLSGVTGVSDFWFGNWSSNSSAGEMVGNYSQSGYWMVENGSYDSGMGWCWKNRTIPAGTTVTFSWLIGVGDVKLEPYSNFEVTPEDPEGWNDLSRIHVMNIEGDYESPAGLSGRIEYAIEDSEEWTALTDMLESGSTFTGVIKALFNPELSTHTIRFRTVDQVGNTTNLHPIVYPDVSFHSLAGITDKVYTGDSIFQTDLTCDLEEEQYSFKYKNNVNVGTASLSLEGVFPLTIGRKVYTFTINPQPLAGSVIIPSATYVYNGEPFMPSWQFSNEQYTNLVIDKDYTLQWSNNTLPGTANLTISGIGNYTGELTATFTIDKAPLRASLYQLFLPDEDITYDEQTHGASIQVESGVGEATIYYTSKGQTNYSTQKPKELGDYDIYLQIAEGSLYYGMALTKVGSFTIYKLDEADWVALQSINTQLATQNWSTPWDLSGGIAHASSLQELTIREGRVVGINISNAGLSGALPENLSALSALEAVNLSGNQLTGNIGVYATLFPNLHSLDVSKNCIEDVYPMISPNVTTLNIGQQAISRVVDIHLSDLSTETIATKVPSILLYDHANQTYTTNINLLCTTSDDSWGMTMSYQNGQLSIPYVSEQNTYYGKSGDILNVAVVNNYGTREGSTFQMKLSFDEGDGNFDGQVNVLDLQSAINYMFEEYDNKPYNFTASNLWEDDVINVQDAVCLVNKLLNTDASPAPALFRRANELSQDAEASIFIEDNQLILDTSVPVSAFDIMVSGIGKCEVIDMLSNLGITCTVKEGNGSAHLIGYSLYGTTLPIGRTILCNLQNGTVTYAMLASCDAQEIKVDISGSMTGIQSNTVNQRTSDAVYRMSLGAKRAIIIDTKGKKTMIKDEK